MSTQRKRRERKYSPNVRTDSQRANFAEDVNIYTELFTLSGIYLFLSEASLQQILFTILGNILFPMAALVSIAHPLFAWIRFGHGHRGMVNRNWASTWNAVFHTLKGIPLGVGIIGNFVCTKLGLATFAGALPFIFICCLSSTAFYCLCKAFYSIYKMKQIDRQLMITKALIEQAKTNGNKEELVRLETLKAQYETIRFRYKMDMKYCFIGAAVTGSLAIACAFVNFVPGFAAMTFAIIAAAVTLGAGIFLVYEFIQNRRALAKKEKVGPQFKAELEHPSPAEELDGDLEAVNLQQPLLQAQPLVHEHTQLDTVNFVAQTPSVHPFDFQYSAEHAAFMSRHLETPELQRDYLVKILTAKLRHLAPLVKNSDLVIQASKFCTTQKVIESRVLNDKNRESITELEDFLNQQVLNNPAQRSGFQLFKRNVQASKHQAKFRVCFWMLKTLCEGKRPSIKTEKENRHPKTGYNILIGDTPLRHVIAQDILESHAPVLQKTKTLCAQSFFRGKSDTEDIMEAVEYFYFPERYKQFAPAGTYERAELRTARSAAAA